LNESEKAAWRSFQKVVKNFLGNKKAKNHEDMDREMRTTEHWGAICI
jgi:hypothetical protein